MTALLELSREGHRLFLGTQWMGFIQAACLVEAVCSRTLVARNASLGVVRKLAEVVGGPETLSPGGP